MREKLEYWLVVAVARTLGRLPRPVAPCLLPAACLCRLLVFGRLAPGRRAQPQMALPGALSPKPETNSCARVYVHLGWQLVEFCRMTRYTPKTPATGCAPRAWITIWPRRPAAKAF